MLKVFLYRISSHPALNLLMHTVNTTLQQSCTTLPQCPGYGRSENSSVVREQQHSTAADTSGSASRAALTASRNTETQGTAAVEDNTCHLSGRLALTVVPRELAFYILKNCR